MFIRSFFNAASIALMLSVLFSCAKRVDRESEIIEEQVVVHCLSMDNASQSKASLSDQTGKSAIVWSQGDKIDVFVNGNGNPEQFNLFKGNGTSSGDFLGNSFGTNNYSKYPYNSTDYFLDNAIYFEIESEQHYVENSFDRNAFIMAAYTDASPYFNFISMSSLLKISLTGMFPVSKITVIAHDESCYLSGTSEIRYVNNTPSLSLMPEEANGHHGKRDRISLECNGQILDEYFPTYFYLVLPPVSLTGGFTLKVETPYGIIQKSVSADIVLKSGFVYEIPCFNLNLYGEIKPSSTLNGFGTEESPFLIESLGDFISFQYAINSGIEIYSSAGGFPVPADESHFRLESDIDLSELFKNGMKTWLSIGSQNIPFCGTFDGNGHTVKGLYVDDDSRVIASLFGYVSGCVRNLNVEGEINADEGAIVVTELMENAKLINCTSKGKVKGQNASGVVFNAAANSLVEGCVNYADITALHNMASGICIGASNAVLLNCVNYGAIQGSRPGGITSSVVCDYGMVANCANYGSVTGDDVGGIAAHVGFQSSVINCMNAGPVYGEYGAGGITCFLQGTGKTEQNEDTRILNCVNVGTVTSARSRAGAICSSVTNSGNSNCTCSNCYWANDIGPTNCYCIGSSTQTEVFRLNRQYFSSRQSTGSVLYESDNANYDIVVDALNAWAFDHTSTNYEYCGWMIDVDAKMVSLTFTQPIKPSGSTDVFSVTPKSISLNHKQQSISVIVKSSSGCTPSVPSWIKQKSVKQQLKDGYSIYNYVFDVDANTSGSSRIGEIQFMNGSSVTTKTDVVQSYTYCSKDYSRNGRVIQLQKALEGNGIDIVFMGDAYTDNLITDGTYENDMKMGVEAFFSEEPYTTYRKLFNVYYVEVVSENALYGSDYNTALNCYFGNGTLVGGNINRCLDFAKSATGKSNTAEILTIVIMNAYKYAGTCWMYTDGALGDYGSGTTVSYFPLGTSSSGQTSFRSLLLHEAGGHGFAKLEDEYAYASNGTIPLSESENRLTRRSQLGWGKNVDYVSDPFNVIWSRFLTDSRYSGEGLGVFEGACTYWKGAYRPTEESIMNHNILNFNAPSREAIYYRIHKLAYGNSWEYDYEKFVEYDAINRHSSTKTTIPYQVDKSIPPLHPPIVVTR